MYLVTNIMLSQEAECVYMKWPNRPGQALEYRETYGAWGMGLFHGISLSIYHAYESIARGTLEIWILGLLNLEKVSPSVNPAFLTGVMDGRVEYFLSHLIGSMCVK